MMDHLTMGHLTMGRLMGHPVGATLAGGASQAAGGGLGHTAGLVVASLGHDVARHPLGAGVAAVLVCVTASIRGAVRRRRRGVRRREPVSIDSHDWSWGEKFTSVVLACLAGAIVWIVATVKSAPATAKAVPAPKVTHTTIVQPVINHITHVTHVTKAAAGGIPTGAWVAICLAMAFLLVAYLNRRGRNR